MNRKQITEYFIAQMKRRWSIDCYWNGGRLVTRSRTPRRQINVHRPPENAIFIGSYTGGFFPADEFISDLQAALARHGQDGTVIPPELD